MVRAPHRLVRVTGVALLVASATAVADPAVTYVEQNGVIVFDVESVEPSEGWTEKGELEGFLGESYFEWTGPDVFRRSEAGPGTLVYRFRVETPGEYQMVWRSRIARGESNTESNDSWLRLASGEDVPDETPLDGWTKVFMNRSESWAWISRTVDHVGDPIRQYFAAGDHTLEIAGRSAGHAIDRVALFRYAEVAFGSQKFDALPISSTVAADGSTVGGEGDSTGGIDPVDTCGSDTTGDSGGTDATGESDGADSAGTDPGDAGIGGSGGSEGEQPAARVNAEPIDENTAAEIPNGECLDGTLALTPTAAVAVNPLGVVSSDSALSVRAEASIVLLRFDLLAVPSPATVVLDYTLVGSAGDGDLDVHLAAHDSWPEFGSLPPEPVLALGTASGGWPADGHLRSVLDRDVPTGSAVSMILSSRPGDDELVLATDAEGPRLLLSGDDSFCTTYTANLATLSEPDPVDSAKSPATPTPAPIDTPVRPSGVAGRGDIGVLGAPVPLVLFAALALRRPRSRGVSGREGASSATKVPRHSRRRRSWR